MDLRAATVRRQGADRALLDGLHTSTPEMLRRHQHAKRPKNADEALWWATERGNAIEVRRALRDAASIDTPRPMDGMTAVHIAAVRGHSELLQALLTAGAQPDLATTPAHETPLLAVVLQNPQEIGWQSLLTSTPQLPDMIARLLKARASLDAVLADGSGVLHCAAHVGSLPLCQALHAAGARCDAVSARGRTVLHTAAAKGNAEIVSWLIAQGAPLHAVDADGADAAAAAASGEATDPAELATLLRDFVRHGEQLMAAARPLVGKCRPS